MSVVLIVGSTVTFGQAAQAPGAAPAAAAGGAAGGGGAGGGGGGRGGGGGVGTPGLALPMSSLVRDIRGDANRITDLELTTITRAELKIDKELTAVGAARTAAATAVFAQPADPAGVTAILQALQQAELTAARAQADAYAGLLAEIKGASPERIALIQGAFGNVGGGGRGGGGGGRGGAPGGAPGGAAAPGGRAGAPPAGN